MATTQVVWNYEQMFDPSLQSAAETKIAQMEQEGKTTGTKDREYLPNNTWLVTRGWTSPEDAQEWIDFLAPYNPVSVTILN
jgi:hypothetical protein